MFKSLSRLLQALFNGSANVVATNMQSLEALSDVGLLAATNSLNEEIAESKLTVKQIKANKALMSAIKSA